MLPSAPPWYAVTMFPSPHNPLPGDFFLARITGRPRPLVEWAQRLIGPRQPAGVWTRTHAGLVIRNNHDGTYLTVEAMPGGARYFDRDLSARGVIVSQWDLDDHDRSHLVRWANRCYRVPYSFLDYLSIGLLHLGVRPGWIQRWVADSRHMICSQLVDEVYLRAGFHLFDDGRAPGDVHPSSLFAALNGPA